MEAVEKTRPVSVEYAVYALAFTLVAGLVQILFLPNSALGGVDPSLFYAMLFGFYAFIGFILFCVWRGKNWARITYASFFVLGLYSTIPALATTFQSSFLTGLYLAAMLLVKFVAIALLFQAASNAWYRPAKT